MFFLDDTYNIQRLDPWLFDRLLTGIGGIHHVDHRIEPQPFSYAVG